MLGLPMKRRSLFHHPLPHAMPKQFIVRPHSLGDEVTTRVDYGNVAQEFDHNYACIKHYSYFIPLPILPIFATVTSFLFLFCHRGSAHVCPQFKKNCINFILINVILNKHTLATQ